MPPPIPPPRALFSRFPPVSFLSPRHASSMDVFHPKTLSQVTHCSTIISPTNMYLMRIIYIYTKRLVLGNHIDWLSRDVFHSDKSTPFCHFPVVEIPHRGELRLACVQPSVRPRTILRLCPTFATVRLWVGPVSYTRNCVSSAAAWYLVILVGPRKCPVAITGHLHLLIDLGAGQLGYFVRRLWTPAFAQEPFSDS